MRRALTLTWLAIGAVSSGAMAQNDTGWNCRNLAYEIGCDESGCKLSDAHTPMDIYLSGDAMEVCAYSGCWTGAPSYTRRGGQFEIWTGYNLPFSTREDWVANVSVTVDTETGIANVLVSGMYAHPAKCEAQAVLVD